VPISMDRLIGKWLYYNLPLEAFTQRNFVADYIRLKLNFILKTIKIAFWATLWET